MSSFRWPPFHLIDRLRHHPGNCVIVGHAFGIGDRFAAGGADFRCDSLGRAGIALIAALQAAAEVVDHHFCAFTRRQQRAFLADAVAAAGNQYDLAVQNAHFILLDVSGRDTTAQMTGRKRRRLKIKV